MSVVMKTAKDTDPPLRGDLDYRVCVIPQVPGKAFAVQVDDSEAARQLADALGDFQLFLLAENVMPDYSNCVWVDCWEDGEWCFDESEAT